MAPYVKTRFTADGLVEIVADVETAHKIRKIIGGMTLPLHGNEGLDLLVTALTHTLAKKDT